MWNLWKPSLSIQLVSTSLDSKCDFITPYSYGIDTKTRKLGAIWLGTKRRRKKNSHKPTSVLKAYRVVTGDEKWIYYDNPKRKIIVVSIGIHQQQIYMNQKSYFVSGGFNWVEFTVSYQKHHLETIPTAIIDVCEPSIEGKWLTMA